MTDDNNNKKTTDDDAVLVHQAADLQLLDVRLRPATAIVSAHLGSFTFDEPQVALLLAGGTIRILRLEELQVVRTIETHSVLRGAAVVATPSLDRLAVTSDSGALSVLSFDNNTNTEPSVVTFGKTGCRRTTPGQYVAADPHGRAVWIGAVEQGKLVQVVHVDATNNPSILTANRSRCLTMAMVALDVGLDNPRVACLECTYADLESDTPATPWEVAYYELDLGLNHVSRIWATAVAEASCLAAVPSRGVLVGCVDGIRYVHQGQQEALWCPLPTRQGQKASTLVTQITVHKQKKNKFFGLAQTEFGDLFKISFDLEEEKVTGIQLAYFDSIPTANSLCISRKKGLLFCASDFGEHALYQFTNIEVPDAPTTQSGSEETATYSPVPRLSNLMRIGTLDNPSPTTSIMVGELTNGAEVSPQVYMGTHRSLSIARHGAAVTEWAVSDLPGVAGAIYTCDPYLVISFADATLVLKMEDGALQETSQTGFQTDTATLACSALKQSHYVQVHDKGVRHIKPTREVTVWTCPGLKSIEYASASESQVIAALAGGEIIYFELQGGNMTEICSKDMGGDVCCVDIGTVESGRSRSLLAIVGCRDQTVRVLSLEQRSLLQQKSSLALKSRPHSVRLQSILTTDKDGNPTGQTDLSAIIGLDDGSCVRVEVDPITGRMGGNPSRRFLGARPVSVSNISLNGQTATLMLSSRPWISRPATGGTFTMAPLSYVPVDHGCSFSTEGIPEGIVATSGKTLRILSVDSSRMGAGEDEIFNTRNVPLRYTPRQMALLSLSNDATQRRVALAIVESDYNEYGLEERKARGYAIDGSLLPAKEGGGESMDMDVDSDDEGEKTKEPAVEENEEDDEDAAARKTSIRGPIPDERGHWGSCVRLIDPSDGCSVLDCVELGRDESAFCCTSVRFHSKGGEPLLAVGTVTEMKLAPMKHERSQIILYRVIGGGKLQLLHRTIVDDGPVLALAHFQGRLVAGIGKTIRLFEMGKRQLLRKCERRDLPTMVRNIQAVGNRVFVGDMLRSIHVFRYDASVNRFIAIAVDMNPRPIVAQELLDFNTVAVSDKFGNVSVLRVPKGADTLGTAQDSAKGGLWDTSRSDTTPKLELLCQYFVGEIVTGMTRSSLAAGGVESLIYVTATGRIGAMLPFSTRGDVELYNQLEKELRTELPRPTGRDPLIYRSHYAPKINVIDGVMMGEFLKLSHEKQTKIAEEIEKPISEILKKIEDARSSLL